MTRFEIVSGRVITGGTNEAHIHLRDGDFDLSRGRLPVTPINFKGSNITMKAPADWNEEANGPCIDLHVMTANGEYLSVWKPNLRERLALLLGAKIRLNVVGGQPPVWIDVARCKEIKS